LVGGEGFSIDASLIRAYADRKKRIPGDPPIPWPQAEEASLAVREYLAALDAARHDEETGAEDGGSNGRGNRGKPPKQVSLTDPQAIWVARKNTDPFFANDADYLIDNKPGSSSRRGHTRQSYGPLGPDRSGREPPFAQALGNYEAAFFTTMPTMIGPQRVRRTLATA
jgi:hypothetical protein